MNIPRIANALGQIDEKHISEAMDYRRIRHTRSWLKYSALAAGVLLVFAAAVIAFREIDISVTPEPDITIISIETEPTVTIRTNPTVTATSDEIISASSVSETNDTASETYDTTEGTETETSDDTPCIGGSDTTFMRRYVEKVENIYIIDQIVEPEVRDDWVENVYLAQSPKEQDDLPAVYQAINDLNISKEDFIAENEKLSDYTGMYFSEEVIDALYLEDISEMKRRLVNPYALYYDGEIYTFDELLQEPQSGENIPDDVLNEYLDYIESVCEQENLLKYMQNDIDSLRR